ncbi:hypothetical protein [Rahnella sp. NRRL B-41462]|uniref:hypothetical protein n=1 Tax=Rahnella sp. NRRL B-41462 TaxID=1610579 RepID=UPI000DD40BD8|nr:hypothetical protein [Rahnella sp. NRRL B-41462]
MTTTAYDCLNKIVASDTRWSADVDLIDGMHILYVDDTGFNKICNRRGGALICAGDGLTIQNLKQWWTAEPFDPDAIPELKMQSKYLVSIMMISAEGERLFDAGPKHVVYDTEKDSLISVFSGSGGAYAASAFMKCGCPKSSVEVAKFSDPKSGGEVKFLELDTQNHNLNDENLDYDTIMNAMTERGILMKFKGVYAANSENVTSIPLREHAQADDIIQALKSGSIQAYAPTGGSAIEWTEERTNKLKEAARRVAKYEKETTN